MTSQEWDFDGTDGSRHAARWDGGSPRYLVLIAHGYGEHLGRYERLAAALVGDGAVVYALDHAGHGRSDGERVLIADLDDVVHDLHTLAGRATAEHPGLPVVLIGHSMGGLIAARFAQAFPGALAALVLSSPVLGTWAAVTDTLAAPQIPDVPLDVSTLSRDPAVGERYAADPLVWHGPFRRPTLEALERAMAEVDAGPSFGDLPTMWIHGDADTLVPIGPSREAVHRLQGGVFVERVYPGARHELFNETNADEVIADVLAFIAVSAVPIA